MNTDIKTKLPSTMVITDLKEEREQQQKQELKQKRIYEYNHKSSDYKETALKDESLNKEEETQKKKKKKNKKK